MLAGEGAVAIWNGIADAGRADFYAWHLHEHMPERVGIPGFVRGRRYRAADAQTQPEFFTLYETQTFQVIQGADYLARLNDPKEQAKRYRALIAEFGADEARAAAEDRARKDCPNCRASDSWGIADRAFRHSGQRPGRRRPAPDLGAGGCREDAPHLWRAPARGGRRHLGAIDGGEQGTQGPVGAGSLGGVAGGM